jgi:hypothetical protein
MAAKAAAITKKSNEIIEPTTEQIRQRAYEIYLQRNAGPGSDVDDWLQAEAELRELAMNKYGTED